MLTKKEAPRRKVHSVVAVVRPVSKRLSRMEDLLIEVRHVQDLQLKLDGSDYRYRGSGGDVRMI